jgi:acyl-CoA thioesterase
MDISNTASAAGPHTIAKACSETMWAQDHASKALGMKLERIAPGEAVLSMAVRADMTNGHGICHGGFIFALADSAFAFACNTYNQRTVAHQCSVTFQQPVRQGETLTAHAVERSRAGRDGIYDVTVRDRHDNIVAEFCGHSRTIAGSLLAADKIKK